jgi:DNA-binding LacI/PurR family transcriptional regulator
MSSSARNGCTLKDLAMESGLSLRVVAGIMNGADGRGSLRFSEATRARVLALARARAYRPNVTARNFVRRRHGVFALVCHSVYAMSPGFLHGVLTTGASHGMIVNLEAVPIGEVKRLKVLNEDCCDGIILAATTDEDLDEAVDALGLPVVRVNCNRRRGNGCITLDEEGAMGLVVEAMVAQGRRRALSFFGLDDHFSCEAREKALRHFSSVHGLSEPLLGRPRTLPPQQQERFLRETLKRNPETDTIIGFEEQMLYIYEVCRAMRLKIGRDLSLFCMHPENHVGFVRPRPDSLRIDYFGIGQSAVESLMGMIDGRKIPSRRFAYEHIPGDRCASGDNRPRVG